MKKTLFIIGLFLFFSFFYVKQASALTGITRPDGDASVQWTSTGTSNYTELTTDPGDLVTQPTTPDTTTYVDNGNSVQNVDRYSMDNSITNVDTVSALDVWVYIKDTKGNSVMSVDLYWDGSLQQNGTVTTSGTTYSWQSASFTGLSLSQTQLDSLQVEITGDSGGRTYTVAALYAEVTYTEAPSVAISLTTDGSVAFGYRALEETIDTTASGIDDVETISVDTGPADLDVESTNFSDGTYNWSLGTGSSASQVHWEFSKDGSAWTSFEQANTVYSLDTNVAQGETRDLYLRLTMPTSTDSYNQYSSTVTIVASAP